MACVDSFKAVNAVTIDSKGNNMDHDQYLILIDKIYDRYKEENGDIEVFRKEGQQNTQYWKESRLKD